MANKTIYVSDEKLWKEAKKLAGPKGLSAVITEALRKYVAERHLEQEGYEDLRFAAGPNGADRIAFNGKLLNGNRYQVDESGGVWPEEEFEGGNALSAVIEIYMTRKGTYIVIGELPERGDQDAVPVYWKSHQGITSLRADAALATLHPTDRANLLDDVSPADDDWATRID